MTDLQRYLKSEFRDPEYQDHELRRLRGGSVGWRWGTALAAWGTLCLFMVNFLYWNS